MVLPDNFNVLGNVIGLVGGDAVGKSTQARIVKDFLEDKGYYVVHLRTPTDGMWGRLQRGALQSGSKLKAGVFGLFDFVSLLPYFEYARRTDFEVKKIDEESLTNGFISDIEEKMRKANQDSKLLFLMERYAPLEGQVYLQGIENTWAYQALAKIVPKPGLVIRLRAPPEQAYERALARGEKLEVTETLDELIKADRNFDNVDLPGVEFVEVYTGDEVLPEESAEKIIEYVSSYKKRKYGRFVKAVRKGWRKVFRIFCDADEIIQREKELDAFEDRLGQS